MLHDSRNGSRSNFIAGVLRLEVPRVRVVFGVSGRLLCLPTMETVGYTKYMLKTCVVNLDCLYEMMFIWYKRLVLGLGMMGRGGPELFVGKVSPFVA